MKGMMIDDDRDRDRASKRRPYLYWGQYPETASGAGRGSVSLFIQTKHEQGSVLAFRNMMGIPSQYKSVPIWN